jgi:hypothetical protein
MTEQTTPAAENPYAAPVAAVMESPPAVAPLPHDGAVRELFDRGKNGAAWFYWIAALSVINTVMLLSQGGRTFALGLAVTMIADSLAAGAALKPGGNMTVLYAALAFDVVVLGLFIFCGWLSQRRILPIYALGMVLYLLDGLLCLSLGLVVGIFIHAYALWSMMSGFLAYRQLNILHRQMMTMATATMGTATIGTAATEVR